MINWRSLKKKYFKSTEEVVSMFLGLVIVVVVVSLIFNFFQRKKGNVDIPGSNNIELTENDGNILKTDGLKSGEYVVVKGDSLWKIAQKNYNDGYKWNEIAKANNLKNPSSIEVGQKLIIPSLEKKEVLTTDSGKGETTITTGEYKVVRGDNLWKIAVRAYGDGYQWTKIWQANKAKLVNPNGLEIGMLLTIPSLK